MGTAVVAAVEPDQKQLEQLERLCSEIPLLPYGYPYKWFTSEPKSKQDKAKVTNFKKIAKNSNFARNFTLDTPSEVAW